MTQTKSTYLVGTGISHSLSPELFRAAYAALGLAVTYELADVTPEGLAAVEALLRANECLGASVTMPFKGWAVSVAERRDDSVTLCGAANLLVRTPAGLHARNTDAMAAARLIEDVRERVEGRVTLLAGAGGAAAATLWALRPCPPRELIIAVRNPAAHEGFAERAREHLALSSVRVVDITALDERARRPALVINATSVGMRNRGDDPLPDVTFTDESALYDFVYRRDGATALQQRAFDAHALVVDGTGHLLEQALPAFHALTGREAPRDVMARELARRIGRPLTRWR